MGMEQSKYVYIDSLTELTPTYSFTNSLITHHVGHLSLAKYVEMERLSAMMGMAPY